MQYFPVTLILQNTGELHLLYIYIVPYLQVKQIHPSFGTVKGVVVMEGRLENCFGTCMILHTTLQMVGLL